MFCTFNNIHITCINLLKKALNRVPLFFLTTDLLKVFYLSKKERARKTSSNKMEVSMQ